MKGKTKTLLMTRKNVHSRAYHHYRTKTGDKAFAAKKAAEAVEAWLAEQK